MTKKPVLPTLMSSSAQLTKPLDILKYVLRSYMSWPMNISDTFNNREISFVYDVADVGWDTETLMVRVNQSLSSVLNSYLTEPASSLDIGVEVERIDEVRYNIKIEILMVVNNVPYSFDTKQKVDNKGQLIYDFEGDNGG